MTTPARRSRATEAFYGRRRGKTMKAPQAAALSALLPALKLDLSSPPPQPLARLWPVPVDEIRLEIGFGGGEHLLHRAAGASRTGFIGVEPFVNSMAKMLGQLEIAGLDNIRVYDDDATRVLDWLPDASIDRIDLLYPDPWPKKKHWKRRFVSRANLDRFARVLKPGGRFGFASDIDTYVNWTLAQIAAHPEFEWTARTSRDWREPWADWPGTRYEAKAIREGRTPCYLEFVRASRASAAG
ncbi:MAG: tRNA (guanine(46)-N(7))-methyltransferase TrmB [Hoeflea sp.]|nr:tRNA (guanine(46)-N(7))-methyltransferase TrmB [Hoeflea sp.]